MTPGAVVHVEAIRKTYGRTVAVDDVSFEVREGEIFGLIGPNGAGKTTTMECVEGLRRPDRGTISVLGLDPARDVYSLQQRIGVLWQTLDPLVKKVLALPQVGGAAVMVEGLVEGLYMPDRGFSGVPIYLIDDTRNYLKAVYSEPALGEHGPFAQLVEGLAAGKVVASSPMGRYYKRSLDQPMPVGRMSNQALARLP